MKLTPGEQAVFDLFTPYTTRLLQVFGDNNGIFDQIGK